MKLLRHPDTPRRSAWRSYLGVLDYDYEREKPPTDDGCHYGLSSYIVRTTEDIIEPAGESTRSLRARLSRAGRVPPSRG